MNSSNKKHEWKMCSNLYLPKIQYIVDAMWKDVVDENMTLKQFEKRWGVSL